MGTAVPIVTAHFQAHKGLSGCNPKLEFDFMTPSPRPTRTEWHWILVFTWSVCHFLKSAHSRPRILHSKTITKAKKRKIKEGQGNCIWSCSRIQHWRWNLSGTRLRRSPEPRTGRFLRMPAPAAWAPRAGAEQPQGKEGREGGRPGVTPGGNKSWLGDKGNEKNASATNAIGTNPVLGVP